jgi:hypothetical protein
MIRQTSARAKEVCVRDPLRAQWRHIREMIIPAPAPSDAGSPADSPARERPGVVAWYAEGLSDALGDRLRLFDNAGPPIELLRFHAAVAGMPGFEEAVRARLDALGAFHHPAFARVRALSLLDDPEPRLALASDLVAGERLSGVLRTASASGVRLDATCAIWLLRHLLPAIAALHDAGPGIAHTLLDPDRVVLTETGEVVLTEYVFGGLAGRLHGRAPIPDIGQAALLAVAVLLGRPLRRDEFADGGVRVASAVCASVPSADILRPWIMRALAPEPEGFGSAREAYHALEALLPGVWGAWPSRLLPAGPAAPDRPRLAAAPAGAFPPAPPARAPLALPPAAEAQRRRLRRVNRTLILVALGEAACIALLIAQGVGSPAPQVIGAPSIQAAGLLPAPAQAVSPALADRLDATATDLVAAAPPAANSVTGWLVVDADAEVRVYANGRLLGSATKRRFGLPEGQHTIAFVNDRLAFRSSQTVRVVSGRSVLLAPRPAARASAAATAR